MLYFAVVINSSLRQFDIIILWGSDDVKVGQKSHHNKCSGIEDNWEKGIVQCKHTILVFTTR